MRVSTGSLLTEEGEEATMAAVVKEAAPKKKKTDDGKKKYLAYNVLSKIFTHMPVDVVVKQEPSRHMYVIETESGDKVVIPNGSVILLSKHGIETMVSVASMHTFRNWATSKIARVKISKGKPEKYWEKVTSVERLDARDKKGKSKQSPKPRPVYDIGGAMGTMQLVYDGFMVK